MDKEFERFDEKLAALEAGETLESCLKELDGDQAGLLQLAASLRAIQPPPRNPDVVSRQLAAVTETAKKQPSARQHPARNHQRWFVSLAAASGALYMVLACVAFIGLGLGIYRGVSWYANRLDAGRAIVQEVEGVLEIQAKDGEWALIHERALVEPGAHLRTRQLSSADLRLEDGSLIHLGALSEITLDQMAWSLSGIRSVRLTQWSGTSEHHTTPAKKKGSRYEVRTPQATTTAMGTIFSLQVDPLSGTSVEVLEGVVDVRGMGITVSVTPGRVTTVSNEQPPVEPRLAVRGEGILVETDAGWTVAGQAVSLGQNTRWIGEGKAGDLVSFVGRQLADGTLQVDRLEKLMTPGYGFKLSSPVEADAQNALVASETVIAVDGDTHFTTDYASGEPLTIEGVIQADETWLATRVYAQDSSQPFQFTGIVQSVGETEWEVSGVIIHDKRRDGYPHRTHGRRPGTGAGLDP
jgi:hypothetical protein